MSIIKISSENINSELSLFTIENTNNNCEKKLLVITNDVRNEKILPLTKTMRILAGLFGEISDEESKFEYSFVEKLMQKIGCISQVGFISTLIPSESIEKPEKKLLLSFNIISAKQLMECYQKNNDIHLSQCCYSCQKNYQEIWLTKDLKAYEEFLFCSNPNCVNFDPEKKGNILIKYLWKS